MVERGNGLCKVTGLVGWYKVLNVLAKKPPAWLGPSEEEMESSHTWWDGDFDEVELGQVNLGHCLSGRWWKRWGVNMWKMR